MTRTLPVYKSVHNVIVIDHTRAGKDLESDRRVGAKIYFLFTRRTDAVTLVQSILRKNRRSVIKNIINEELAPCLFSIMFGLRVHGFFFQQVLFFFFNMRAIIMDYSYNLI